MQRLHLARFLSAACLAVAVVVPAAASTGFIHNQGQFPAEVFALYRSEFGDIYFTSGAIVFDIHDASDVPIANATTILDPFSYSEGEDDVHLDRCAVFATPVGAVAPLRYSVAARRSAQVRYIVGGEDLETQGIPADSYDELRIEDVWPGITLVFSGDPARLNYRIISTPDADLSVLQFSYAGGSAASTKSLVDGLVVVETGFGALHGILDNETTMAGYFEFEPALAPVSMATGKSFGAQEVIWSTMLRGAGEDHGLDVLLGDDNRLYFLGVTRSSGLPTTPGAYQTSWMGVRDLCIAEYSAIDGTLRWLTYLGGSGEDAAHSIQFDAQGRLIICGSTTSTNFPTTPGAYDRVKSGSAQNGFIAALNPDGGSLAWSTYFGGTLSYVTQATVTSDGNLAIHGVVASPEMPVTPDAFDRTYNYRDAWIGKISADGAQLLWCSYIGGSDVEYASTIDELPDGRLVLGGTTLSTDFPVTAGAHDLTNGGGGDGWLAIISPSGSHIEWCSFVGGSRHDALDNVLVDDNGDIVALLRSQSTDIAATSGAWDTTPNGGLDFYLTKFDGDSLQQSWATFIGGTGNEIPRAMRGLQQAGGYYAFAGYSDSPSLPTTDGSARIGGTDCVAMAITTDGTNLVWGTMVGGSGTEILHGLAIDRTSSAVFLAGFSNSADFPIVPGGGPGATGGYDGFVLKLGIVDRCTSAVSGVVQLACNGAVTPNYGVEVDLFDAAGFLVATDTSAPDGTFRFDGLCAGEYVVSCVTPLGQVPTFSDMTVTLDGLSAAAVTAAFTCAPGIGEIRGIGFWKHQFVVANGGRGHAQWTGPQLCALLAIIDAHFYQNDINEVDVYIPAVSGLCADNVAIGSTLLNLRGQASSRDRARQGFFALLLNVAAGHIQPSALVSADGATMSQCVTYCDGVLADPAGAFEAVRAACEMVMAGVTLPAGTIPLDTPIIAYRGAPERVRAPIHLAQNNPNPFNPSTAISFDLRRDQRVALDVYTLDGRSVRTLLNRVMASGHHAVTWDGCDQSGRALPAGTYLYRLSAEDGDLSRRMVLLK